MKFRRKYFHGRCPNCNSTQRLKLTATDDELGVVTMTCLTCSLSHAYPVERVRKTGRILTKAQLEKFKSVMSKILKYKPEETYFVGQEIRHPVFDEVGKVVKKETTEGNNRIIVVEFEESGKKRLVEGLK